MPAAPPAVRMYVCGVTVYDYCHIGHARCYVAFDVVQRTLRKRGFELTYVRNFTDVDDKIIRRAAELGEDPRALSSRFIDAFHQDMGALGVEKADLEPRVTDHIPEIVRFIEELVAKEHAYLVPGEYEAGSSDVYFAIDAFPGYGKLSGRQADDNQAGASERVEVDTRKRNPMDFALWKSAKPGEISWNSPWGMGRPGWHIECSVMSCKHLGASFDLHGGGKDLVFPHHENELAQSEAHNDAPFVRYWLHNGFVNIDEEKMSKSLGNFFTIREVLKHYHPQVLRYFLLGTHYRSPINYSTKNLDDATTRVLYIYESLQRADVFLAQRGLTGELVKGVRVVDKALAEIIDALEDDFNTARALGALAEPLKALGDAMTRPKDPHCHKTVQAVRGLFTELAGYLGVFGDEPATIVEAIVESARERLFPSGSDVRADIERMVTARVEARVARDWARSDALRAELVALGVELRDTKEGTLWRPVLAEA